MVDIVDKALRMGEGRQIKKLEHVAQATNALEDEIAALNDEELKGQTAKFKQRLDNGESLDRLMPEAFATVREASKRTLGLRHFDVQLMGGAALHWGNIAEMKTGEGKTLVATLPAYLNALDGQGVHVVTVNDYLASYQAELMGRVYRFLGMSTGCIITNQKPPERRKQYNADITECRSSRKRISCQGAGTGGCLRKKFGGCRHCRWRRQNRQAVSVQVRAGFPRNGGDV